MCSEKVSKTFDTKTLKIIKNILLRCIFSPLEDLYTMQVKMAKSLNWNFAVFKRIFAENEKTFRVVPPTNHDGMSLCGKVLRTTWNFPPQNFL